MKARFLPALRLGVLQEGSSLPYFTGLSLLAENAARDAAAFIAIERSALQ